MKIYISQSDMLWYAFAFLISVLFAGSLNGFQFQDSVSFQLHDSYYLITVWELTLIIFMIVGFVVMFTVSIKCGFKQLGKLWLLLIHCVLTLLAALYFFYTTYSLMVGIAMVEFMKTPGVEQPENSLMMNTVRTFLIIIGLLVIGLLLMFRRIKEVKKGM